MKTRELLLQHFKSQHIDAALTLLKADPALFDTDIENGKTFLQLLAEAGTEAQTDYLTRAISAGRFDIMGKLLDYPGFDTDAMCHAALPRTINFPDVRMRIQSAMICYLLETILKSNTGAFADLVKDPLFCEFVPPAFSNKYHDLITELRQTAQSVGASSFMLYAKTLRQLTNIDLVVSYLQEMHDALQIEKAAAVRVTKSERVQVNARRLWSDVVATRHAMNKDVVADGHVKTSVIERLVKLGYGNTEAVYAGCIKLLQENSVIVVTFNAKVLGNKNTDKFQLLNFHETRKNNFAVSKDYKDMRESLESRLFSGLKDRLKGDGDNKHAHPRYASLQLLSADHTITAASMYGSSYMVLTQTIKHNALYNYCDSLNADIMPAVDYHHFEILLHQSSDIRLNALAKQVTSGVLPRYNGHEEYIEVMLPAINCLTPDMVQFIYVSPEEYQLTQADKAVIAQAGITVSSNHSGWKTYREYLKNLAAMKVREIEAQFKNSPYLVKLFGNDGLLAIHVASKACNLELFLLCMKYGADVCAMTHQGKSALDFAITSGNKAFFDSIIPYYTYRATPDFLKAMLLNACLLNYDDYYFKVFVDMAGGALACQASSNRLSILALAVHNDATEKVLHLLQLQGANWLEECVRVRDDKALGIARNNKNYTMVRILRRHAFSSQRPDYSPDEIERMIDAEIDAHKIEVIAKDRAMVLDGTLSNFLQAVNAYRTNNNLKTSFIADFKALHAQFKDDPAKPLHAIMHLLIGFIITTQNNVQTIHNSQSVRFKKTPKFVKALDAIKINMIDLLNKTFDKYAGDDAALAAYKNYLKATLEDISTFEVL